MEYTQTMPTPQPLPLARKPVIYFDWDGTLAHSMPLCLEQLRLTLQELGLPPQDNSALARCNGPTYQESVGVLGIPADKAELFLRTRQRIEMELVPTWQQLFPGVKAMLEALAPHADLAIVSNGLPDYLHLSLEVTGVKHLFTRVQPMMPGKTKTQALAITLSQMQPPRAIMVGDRQGDFLAGRDNGLPTLAACFGYGLPNEWALADAQAYSVEKMTAQLQDFIA